MARAKQPKPVKVQNSIALVSNAFQLDFHIEGNYGDRDDFYHSIIDLLNQKQFTRCTRKWVNSSADGRDRWTVYTPSSKLAMKVSMKARDLANKHGLTLHNVPKSIMNYV